MTPEREIEEAYWSHVKDTYAGRPEDADAFVAGERFSCDHGDRSRNARLALFRAGYLAHAQRTAARGEAIEPNLYRKKEPITAFRFDPEKPLPDGVEEVTDVDDPLGERERFYVRTREGVLRILPGDYVATGARGEHWPIAGDRFHEMYEPCARPAPPPASEPRPDPIESPIEFLIHLAKDGPFSQRLAAERAEKKLAEMQPPASEPAPTYETPLLDPRTGKHWTTEGIESYSFPKVHRRATH